VQGFLLRRSHAPFKLSCVGLGPPYRPSCPPQHCASGSELRELLLADLRYCFGRSQSCELGKSPLHSFISLHGKVCSNRDGQFQYLFALSKVTFRLCSGTRTSDRGCDQLLSVPYQHRSGGLSYFFYAASSTVSISECHSVSGLSLLLEPQQHDVLCPIFDHL
jgi:hypothetical protein